MAQFNFQPNLNLDENVLGDQIEYQHWEAMEISGYPIKFIKAVKVEENKIFNESTARSFTSANGYSMRCKRSDDSFYAGTETFGGFGYAPSYSDNMFVAVKYFKDIGLVPEEQDLIFDEVQNILFQITKVDTLLESQSSVRVNDRMFSYTIYLKHYSQSYKDSIDTELSEEMLETGYTDDILDALNSDLNDAIDELVILDETRKDDVFGDLR